MASIGTEEFDAVTIRTCMQDSSAIFVAALAMEIKHFSGMSGRCPLFQRHEPSLYYREKGF